MSIAASFSPSRSAASFSAVLSRFRWGVTASALAFAVATLFVGQPAGWDLGLLLCSVMAVMSERWLLTLPSYGPFTLSEAAVIATMLRSGPAATLLVVVLAGLSRFLRETRDGKRAQEAGGVEFMSYSVSQNWLAYGSASWLWFAGRGLGPMFAATPVLDGALMLLSVAIIFCVQAYLVALHHWLDQQCLGAWSTRINWPRLRLLGQALLPLGVLLAACLQVRTGAALLLLGPLWVTYSSLRHYTLTLREAQQVVNSLARAVERREPHTVGHAARVSQLASDMGRHMRMPESDVRTLASAANLHELGKISLGDAILCKSGRLAAAEWERVRRYPAVGAEVAGQLSLSRREAVIIRHHQERFDGQGYPQQLQGDRIPLGARVLAVAKAFDAMISRRSYRPALTWQQALRELRSCAGSQFDPRAVAALEDVLGLGNRHLRAA